MRRDHKTEKEKELLRLDREMSSMWGFWRSRNNVNAEDESGYWLALDEPYQDGWERHYVLRPDIKNRRDAGVISKLLDMMNSVVRCDRKDFMVRDWRKGRKAKAWKEVHQPLHTIAPATFRDLNEQEKAFFSEMWEYSHGKPWRQRYKFDRSHFFVFHIEPHIITHHWIPNGEWETRKAELSHQIDRNNLWPAINKANSHGMRGWYDYDWWELKVARKYGKHENVIGEQLREHLREIEDEEVA